MGVENDARKKHQGLIGQQFGRLTVVENVTDAGRTRLLCKCSCGKSKIVRLDHLRSGRVVSCGCYQSDIRGKSTRTHGQSKTRLYRIWKNMRTRCRNEHIPGYELWGGRGISVCEEWNTFQSFYEWALSNGYRDDLSLDRIDNDGNYEPQNCKWSTKTQQARNRRSNAMITYDGVTKHISDWDNDIGAAKSGRVRARLNAGWSVERAVTTPVHGEKL